VLRTHEPDHILLQATREDAARGLLDIQRLGEMLLRVKGRIMHQRLSRVSPLAVPIMLEISKERVPGEARSEILADAAEALIREAMGEPPLAIETSTSAIPKRAGSQRNANGRRARALRNG
jgi:ATP-dependent Lhr-like helicase